MCPLLERIHVKPAERLRGALRVPGDKSISHRAIIMGAIAEGDTVIDGFLMAEDTMRTVEAFRAMGIRIDGVGRSGHLRAGSHRLVVHGRGLYGLRRPRGALYAGNSGTTARLLSGILAGQAFSVKLSGDESLRRRPMGRIAEPLGMMGAKIAGRKGGSLLPLVISGGRLNAIKYAMPVASAQVKSAILLAGLYAAGTTTVVEPVGSRDHTERMLVHFGARVRKRGCAVSVEGPASLSGRKVHVPGDISAAAFFMVAAAILPGSRVLLRNVGLNPTRNAVIEVLRGMGASVRVSRLRSPGFCEPAGNIEVSGPLRKPLRLRGEIIPRLIDEIPVLAVAACFAPGTSRIEDARELRVKETDRIHALSANLKKLGAGVRELDDGLVVRGGRKKLHGGRFRSFGDHRTAMAMVVAALAARGPSVVEDTACIRTSFPEFVISLQGLLD